MADAEADADADANANANDIVAIVLDIVASIPPGRVMSYGQVAATFGSRSARGVGGIMAHHGSDVPWWRVVRAGGLPPQFHDNEALEHYRAEGTPLLPRADGGYRIAASAFV